MLVFYQPGWAFLVSTVFRTPRAIARRDIALLLGGSEASKRRWPPFSKAISIHVLALMVQFLQEREGSCVLCLVGSEV